MEAGPSESVDVKRILIVEDESIIALSESMLLKKKGYAVDIASSGEAALDRMENGPIPNLILMDIDLGRGIDGTVTARTILQRRKLPIVFLTSHSSEDMVAKVRDITRYGYIIKNSGDFVMLSSIEMAFDLFDKERLLEEKNLLLQRAENTVRIGFWFISQGSSTISLSNGARAILGIETESCSFEEFQGRVLGDSADARAEAFRVLIENGKPYDISYRIRRSDTGEIVTLRSSARVCENSIVGVFQDISEIEGLLGDLRESEARQAITLRSIGDGVISTDIGGRVVGMNRMAERLTGWNQGDAKGCHITEVFEIVNATTRAPVENPVQKVIASGYVVGLANHTVLIAQDGTERHIADSAAPIKDDNGALLGMVLVFRDVTSEYRAQETIRHNEEVFRTLFTDSHTPMLLVDPRTGEIEESNRAAERFYGWPMAKLRQMNIAEINVLGPGEIAEEMNRAIRSLRTEFRFKHRLADGQIRQVRVASGPIDIDGKGHLLSIINDATEAYKTEVELGAERERSGLLMRDANHRMKNNAQMISSLIQLQMGGMEDPQALSALRELQNRIACMTVLYDQLSEDNGNKAVSSLYYIDSLLDVVSASYLPSHVTLRKNICDVMLETRFSLSLGLITGELITNACKYAFPTGTEGCIWIEFAEHGDEAITLVVGDNGIGMQASPGLGGETVREGIGLCIVRNLVAQEMGTMELNTNGEGTSIRCSFPANVSRKKR
jgi:two-component system, sensor histidine kinase PdtaS